MFFIYFLSVLKIKLTHDCNSYDSNLNGYKKELIEYAISCPNNKIQKINLINTDNVESVSISKDSNVIITCSNYTNELEQINLLVYDNPSITFQNDCNFKGIEIYGSPKFDVVQDARVSAKNAFLTNRSYHFPFYAENITFSSNKQNNILQSKTYHQCTMRGLFITLNKDSYDFRCDSVLDTLEYDQSSENVFNCTSIYVQITLSRPLEDLDSKMEGIISALFSQNKLTVYFIDFPDPASVLKYGDYFKIGNFAMWMQIAKYPKNCLWDYKFDYSQEWLDIVSETSWQLSCVNNVAYLYHGSADEPIDGGIVYLSTTVTIVIICCIVIGIVALIATFCLVAKCRYNKLMKIYD